MEKKRSADDGLCADFHRMEEGLRLNEEVLRNMADRIQLQRKTMQAMRRKLARQKGRSTELMPVSVSEKVFSKNYSGSQGNENK